MVEYTEQVKGKKSLRVSFKTSEKNKQIVAFLKKNLEMDKAFNSVLIEEICPQVLNAEGIREKTKTGLRELLGGM